MSLSGRNEKTKITSKKKRKSSSRRWLERQLNDPYVAEAEKKGYRSRAAFKLLELNEKFHFLKPGLKVLDLGAAPGGWSQIVVKIVGKNNVIAVDFLEMEPIAGVNFLQDDFLEEETFEKIKDILNGDVVDIVLSDMAPQTTGHQQTDHLRIMALAETAFDAAKDILKPGGTFVSKLFQGGGDPEFQKLLKASFKTVKNAKPPSSRKDSSELFIVAQGFRGE